LNSFALVGDVLRTQAEKVRGSTQEKDAVLFFSQALENFMKVEDYSNVIVLANSICDLVSNIWKRRYTQLLQYGSHGEISNFSIHCHN
jgi:hypothetical protein